MSGEPKVPYSWKQTLSDVTILLDLPAEITKASQLNVSIQPKHLSVAFKSTCTPLISGDLHKACKVDDSTWTIGDQSLVSH